MLKPGKLIWTLLVCFVVDSTAVGGGPADLEQEATARPEAQDAREEVEGFWQVDSILEQAVRNIALRYNLNETQTEFTRHMMVSRVKRFLDDHQDEVWPLVRDLARYQREGGLSDAKIAQRLGPIASRILQEAKDEILRSNEEWGEILTEEQRRVHEYDLREMDKTFNAMENRFGGWEEGRVADGSVFPQPRPLKNQPPRPRKPHKAGLPDPDERQKEDGGRTLASHFEAYVERFIADYELTKAQREAANSILREISERNAAFHKAHEEELQEIRGKLAEAGTPAERRRLTSQRRHITKPLDNLFAEFKARLDQIPDKAQLARHVSKSKGGGAPKAAIDGSRGERRKKSETPEQPGEKEKAENR